MTAPLKPSQHLQKARDLIAPPSVDSDRARLETLDYRLRQVLRMIASASTITTTIDDGSDQGGLVGDGPFVDGDLITEAGALLKSWDQEDEAEGR